MDVDSHLDPAKGIQPLHENGNELSLNENAACQSSLDQQNDDNDAMSWKGWAELENDPDIFTTILQEWGIKDVRVNELYDISMVFERSVSNTIGLIFLSRYMPTETNGEDIAMSEVDCEYPWFANQISRFSCGTVALMNVVMNCESLDLGSALVDFKTNTLPLSSKNRGVELDNHREFRDVHNSFATKLDRMIVDVTLKEDFQAAKQKSKKAKRKRRKRRRKRGDDEDDSGFHFVAYLHAHGAVWKLDGVEAEPSKLRDLGDPEVTWTQIAAEDIQHQMLRAQDSGFDFSLMDVTTGDHSNRLEGGIDSQRIREDWAPFIEHMLRLHAERGDLASLLGL